MKKDMMKIPTLLQAVERVVELSKDSKLSDEFMQKALPEIGLLAERFGITERQAVLFCVCMEKGPRRVDFDDLANYLDVNNIRILSYASDIDALVHRRLLRYRDANDAIFVLHDDVELCSTVLCRFVFNKNIVISGH